MGRALSAPEFPGLGFSRVTSDMAKRKASLVDIEAGDQLVVVLLGEGFELLF